jgi:hypothetical protein
VNLFNALMCERNSSKEGQATQKALEIKEMYASKAIESLSLAIDKVKQFFMRNKPPK